MSKRDSIANSLRSLPAIRKWVASTGDSRAEACAQAAGLYEGGRKPIYVGHSFGGSQVFFAAAANCGWV